MVNDALDDILGKGAARAFRYHIQIIEPALAKRDRFDALAFEAATRKLFGETGSLTIKSMILKKICMIVGHSAELDVEDFVGAISKLKITYC